MNILTLDTAMESSSVALYQDGSVFCTRKIIPQGHTKIILDMCDEVLASGNIAKSQLDLIACGRGPGSFTGVRIALAVAQGLSLGLGVKLLGVSDLQSLAQGCIRRGNSQYIAVATDARMGEVYFAIYENISGLATEIHPEKVCSPHSALEDIQQILQGKSFTAVGTGFGVYPQLQQCCSESLVTQASDNLPDAQDLIPYTLKHYSEADLPEKISATYLRNSVTWKKVSEQHSISSTK